MSVCVTWFDFLWLFVAVSNQLLTEDVLHLREGLEEVKKEKELEPDNFILFISHSHSLFPYYITAYLM